MTAPAAAPVVGVAAATPPERVGGSRDGVALMVASAAQGTIGHTRFRDLPGHVASGDLVVVNVSATIPASVDGRLHSGEPVRLHLSSPLAGDVWTVEPRLPSGVGSARWDDFVGGLVRLPGGAEAALLVRDPRSPRLWVTELRGLGSVLEYLHRHGQPIRYDHTARRWPLTDYQNVYALEPGSAEMPSAGRPFTTDLVTTLMARGVALAPLVLHGGVASFEDGELPDAERFRVPEATARMVNTTREAGGRVIAVGTTSVRALESAADSTGTVHPMTGVTDLVITAERGVRVIDGLVTGWHDGGAPHLALVEAVGGRGVVERCYREAASRGYRWHEFGDSLLLLRR